MVRPVQPKYVIIEVITVKPYLMYTLGFTLTLERPINSSSLIGSTYLGLPNQVLCIPKLIEYLIRSSYSDFLLSSYISKNMLGILYTFGIFILQCDRISVAFRIISNKEPSGVCIYKENITTSIKDIQKGM